MNENETNQTEKLELSNEQSERVKEVQKAAYDFCGVLMECPNLGWDAYLINEIVDLATSAIVGHGIPVRYPSIVNDENGSLHIEEYVNNLDEPEYSEPPF